MDTISWNDFALVELRTGTVLDVQDFPEARAPAYKIRVDFGPELGIRKTSARVTHLYSKEALLGRQVIGLVNIPPRQIGPVQSEFLLTGFVQGDGSVVLAVPERPVANGLKLA
ncbi:MAG: tRNA-binding protein [Desulfovibrio sp.]|nr:tRNA-binding protein [Desulfovibrio sp.]MCA1986925.1 tRNA-binding protein [Desulfovibrio sp.]